MTSRRPTAVFQTAFPSQTGLMTPLTRVRPWRRTLAVNVSQSTGVRDAGGAAGAPFSLPTYAAAPIDQAASSAGVPAIAPAAGTDCCG